MNWTTELTQLLSDTFEDQRIDALEKATLFETFKPLSSEQRAFVRNQAFDIMKRHSRTAQSEPPFKWLEQVLKSLDNSMPKTTYTGVYFSPGDECLSALLNLIDAAVQSLDICVFTISDNQLRDALFKAHRRGVTLRIITDNDKTDDIGSDIDDLNASGIPVREDTTRHHMHHKFAIADRKRLATGSFNWTRSASQFNHENVLILEDESIIERFCVEFERLWDEFS
ncbi:phospholipase D-like domain-containing protein [Reinekea sp. G2M2-21]|uniref:phospholipase D-like domain-containing protein n=1 Tax=Reinekea sp. G2M2-21 TaxID=2788942 RepID=UPI0018AA4228|nr:phospholipase D-like domain-containing protein [Reinekea sp. G2M2-21]